MALPQHPITANTMPTVTVTSATSPYGTIYTVTGSVNPAENANYDISFYNERGRLSRVLKKRYCVFGTNQVRNVAELVALTTGQDIGI